MYQENKNALPINYKLREYRIAQVLNSGGFGITYKAYDTHSEKWVVIKEYFPKMWAIREGSTSVSISSSNDRDFYRKGLERFVQEAGILARYQHENIVSILDLFEANGTAYYAMEYYPSKDLLQVIRSRKTHFSEDEIMHLLIPLLEGLSVIHNDNIFHRDLKPENILIKDNGVPVLIDFGASKFIRKGDNLERLSSFNPNTSTYAAPEQTLETPRARDIGAFTDIFSLGAILYILMSGKLSVSAKDRGAAMTQDDERDPYVSITQNVQKGQYSDRLLYTVDKMLQMKKKSRPQSTEEVLSLLGLVIEKAEGKEKKAEIKKSIVIPKKLAVTGGSYDMEFEGVDFSLKIPAGVKDGQSLRIRHLEDTRLNGSDAVLYVTVRIDTTGSSDQGKGFWAKLSSGDFGLAKTYWIYGCLVGMGFNILFRLINSPVLIILLMLMQVAYSVLVMLGTWRAAERYSGQKIWAILAKIITVISALSMIYIIVIVFMYLVN